MKTYLVGGAVRDLLLGKEAKDRDFVVVGSTKEEMLSLGFEEVSQRFPVFLHPETREEYALARKEKKSGSGHTSFSVEFSPDVSLEEDLFRRDLTMNAMALDGETLIDPYGGKEDLQNKLLRAVSSAFSEDPLRVLRLARFKALMPDFEIEEKTVLLARSLKSELKTLSEKRIALELKKACSGDLICFFKALDEMQALSEVFPFIYKMKEDKKEIFFANLKKMKNHSYEDILSYMLYEDDGSLRKLFNIKYDRGLTLRKNRHFLLNINQLNEKEVLVFLRNIAYKDEKTFGFFTFILSLLGVEVEFLKEVQSELLLIKESKFFENKEKKQAIHELNECRYSIIRNKKLLFFK